MYMPENPAPTTTASRLFAADGDFASLMSSPPFNQALGSGLLPKLIADLGDQIPSCGQRTGHPEKTVDQSLIVRCLHLDTHLLQPLGIFLALITQRIEL